MWSSMRWRSSTPCRIFLNSCSVNNVYLKVANECEIVCGAAVEKPVKTTKNGENGQYYFVVAILQFVHSSSVLVEIHFATVLSTLATFPLRARALAEADFAQHAEDGPD